MSGGEGCAAHGDVTAASLTAGLPKPRTIASAGSMLTAQSSTAPPPVAGHTRTSSGVGLPQRAVGAGRSSAPILTLVKPQVTATSAEWRRVTIREVREWQRWYEGVPRMSLADIAERAGRSKATIHRHLSRAGVELRAHGVLLGPHPNRVPHAEVERTVALYESGLCLGAVGEVLGLGENAVLARLRGAGVQLRSRSEAAKAARGTPHRFGRQLPPELDARVIALVGEGRSLSEVGRMVGVGHSSVTGILRRNGVSVPSRADGVRRAWELRRAGTPPPPRVAREGEPCPRRVRPAPQLEPVDAEEVSWVVTRPLAVALDSAAARVGLGAQDALCARAGISDRLLRRWRVGERRLTHLDVAERVLRALDVLWWDVFEPADHLGLFSATRSRDVVAWCEAGLRAAECWGDG